MSAQVQLKLLPYNYEFIGELIKKRHAELRAGLDELEVPEGTKPTERQRENVKTIMGEMGRVEMAANDLGFHLER